MDHVAGATLRGGVLERLVLDAADGAGGGGGCIGLGIGGKTSSSKISSTITIAAMVFNDF
jgi:hypothetical protein